jgi:hypothetical protein
MVAGKDELGVFFLPLSAFSFYGWGVVRDFCRYLLSLLSAVSDWFIH